MLIEAWERRGKERGDVTRTSPPVIKENVYRLMNDSTSDYNIRFPGNEINT